MSQPVPQLNLTIPQTPQHETNLQPQFTPSNQQTPTSPVFIRQLPPYYPSKLHDYNLQLGRIPQIVKASNFLDVPPLFLCIVVISIFCVLVFAKFLVNFILILALFLSSLYNCLFMTAALDTIVFSQVLNLTASLAFLAIYLLISPFFDMCLDWIPFYHPAKLFIAFSLTYHANSTTNSPDSNPFPLVSVDGNIQQQYDPQQQQLHQQSYHHVSTVPSLPPTIKAIIDLIQSIILLAQAYVIRFCRQLVWNLRTWAYNLKTDYNIQESILEGDIDLDESMLVRSPTKANLNHNNNNHNINDQELDEILEEYAIDEFNTVPDANQVE